MFPSTISMRVLIGDISLTLFGLKIRLSIFFQTQCSGRAQSQTICTSTEVRYDSTRKYRSRECRREALLSYVRMLNDDPLNVQHANGLGVIIYWRQHCCEEQLLSPSSVSCCRCRQLLEP